MDNRLNISERTSPYHIPDRLRKPFGKALILLLALAGLMLKAGPVSAQDDSPIAVMPLSPPVFETDSSNFTNSGSIKLSWYSGHEEGIDRETEYELQRATKPDHSDAKTYYRGPDLATYISGLADGRYYFRIREVAGELPQSDWSTTVEVAVEHHSLNLALTLFGIGGLVFILTLIVVLRGAALTSESDRQSDVSNTRVGG
jgi:hypothetical protein